MCVGPSYRNEKILQRVIPEAVTLSKAKSCMINPLYSNSDNPGIHSDHRQFVLDYSTPCASPVRSLLCLRQNRLKTIYGLIVTFQTQTLHAIQVQKLLLLHAIDSDTEIHFITFFQKHDFANWWINIVKYVLKVRGQVTASDARVPGYNLSRADPCQHIILKNVRIYRSVAVILV